MRALIARGVPHNEALLNCSKTFNDLMCEHCMKAVLERDQRAIKLADKNPAAALYAYRQLGMLDPPWATYKRGKERHFVHELATSLDTSRPNREYALRSRIVRVETSEGYSATRLTPQQLTLPAVDHVISAADVARLRGGETLVLDPNPALLPPEGMAAVMADLMRMVQHGRGVVESHNPCNSGVRAPPLARLTRPPWSRSVHAHALHSLALGCAHAARAARTVLWLPCVALGSASVVGAARDGSP